MRVDVGGTRMMYDPRNLIISSYFGDMYKRFVPAPAAVANNIFILDFQKRLKTIISDEDNQSDEKMNQLLSMIVASYDKVDVEALASKLSEMGLRVEKSDKDDSDKDAVVRIVRDIQKRIAQITTESGMSNLIIKNVLTEKAGSLNLDELGKINLNAVSGVVDLTQKFYAEFVSLEKGDTLAASLAEKFSDNPVLSGLHALYRIMHSGSGAFVQCRESYIMDELFKVTFDEPLVSKKTLLQSKAYSVTKVAMPNIKYSESLHLFMWSLTKIMGLVDDTGGDIAKINISTLVDQIVTGVGQNLPFVPVEAGKPDMENMEKHYTAMFALHAYRRMITDQPGDFRNRVMNSIKTNKFWKLESMEKAFNEHLYVLSVAFEAFRDCAFYYRDLYRNENLMFEDWKDLHFLKRRQLTSFMEEMIGNFTDFSFGMEHPAYYKLPGHITQHTASTFSAEPIKFDYAFPRTLKNKVQPFILGDKLETFLRIFTAGIVSGSWWDLNDGKLPRSLRVMSSATQLDPVYFFTLATSDPLLATKVVKHLYSIYPLTRLDHLRHEYGDVFDEIISLGQVMRFRTSEELSMAMQIPIEIADLIWEERGGSDYFLDLSALQGVKIFLDPVLAPMYEVKALSADRYVSPFVGMYPLVDEEVSMSFAVQGETDDPRKRDVYTKEKGKGNGNGNGKKKDDKGAGKGKDDAGDDGKGGSGSADDDNNE